MNFYTVGNGVGIALLFANFIIDSKHNGMWGTLYNYNN